MSKLQRAIVQIAIELIENKAILSELERAFDNIRSDYYWQRKAQVEKRIKETEEILFKAKIGYDKDTPIEQIMIIVK